MSASRLRKAKDSRHRPTTTGRLEAKPEAGAAVAGDGEAETGAESEDDAGEAGQAVPLAEAFAGAAPAGTFCPLSPR